MTPTAPLTTAADVQEAARWILCMVDPQEKFGVLQNRIAEYLAAYIAQRPATACSSGGDHDWYCTDMVRLHGNMDWREARFCRKCHYFESVSKRALPPGSPSSQTDTGDK